MKRSWIHILSAVALVLALHGHGVVSLLGGPQTVSTAHAGAPNEGDFFRNSDTDLECQENTNDSEAIGLAVDADDIQGEEDFNSDDLDVTLDLIDDDKTVEVEIRDVGDGFNTTVLVKVFGAGGGPEEEEVDEGDTEDITAPDEQDVEELLFCLVPNGGEDNEDNAEDNEDEDNEDNEDEDNDDEDNDDEDNDDADNDDDNDDDDNDEDDEDNDDEDVVVIAAVPPATPTAVTAPVLITAPPPPPPPPPAPAPPPPPPPPPAAVAPARPPAQVPAQLPKTGDGAFGLMGVAGLGVLSLLGGLGFVVRRRRG